MPDKKKLFPGLRPAIYAAAAGLLAGALAVYVTGGTSGNNGAEPVAAAPSSAVPAADEASCAAAKERGAELAKAATGAVAGMVATDPPQSLANLAFNGPDGKASSIGSMKGKVLLVNLWATWCAPCRAEMPELDELQAKKGGGDFEVVALNVDTGDDSKPKAFLEETGIHNLAYYRENTLAAFNELKRRNLALGLPVTLLVDREGCVIANMNGPAAWASEDAQAFVEAALAR